MWIRWISEDIAYVPMQWTWMDPPLVAISCAIALVSAVLALWLVRQAGQRPWRGAWQSAATLTLGAGLWGMHFAGLRAFALCSTTEVAWLHGLLSTLPGLLAAAWLVVELTRPHPHRGRLLCSALAFGLGSVLAHFWELRATSGAHFMDHAPLGVLLALAVGMALSATAALRYVRHRSLARTLGSGVLLGLGMAALHHVAMDAVYLPLGPDPEHRMPLESLWTPLTLAAALGLAAGAVLWGLYRFRGRRRAA